jgi:hypothetical protein
MKRCLHRLEVIYETKQTDIILGVNQTCEAVHRREHASFMIIWLVYIQVAYVYLRIVQRILYSNIALYECQLLRSMSTRILFISEHKNV